MDKISIIVPIYNQEQYLKQCIESILTQSYKNIELLLINDGSTDSSLSICKSFKKEDSRVRVITKLNGGLSSARNLGLDVATGKLVMFVDPDDWLLDDAIKKLYDSLLDNQSDIAVGAYIEYVQSKGKYLIYSNDDKTNNYTPLKWFGNEYEAKKINFVQLFTTAWAKLFKTSLWKHVRFPIGEIAEDDLTIWKSYLLSNKITFINSPVMCYRRHSNSIVHTHSLSSLVSYKVVEQRLVLLNRIFNDSVNEKRAFLWRMGVHYRDDLKLGKLNSYYDVASKREILKKYKKL